MQLACQAGCGLKCVDGAADNHVTHTAHGQRGVRLGDTRQRSIRTFKGADWPSGSNVWMQPTSVCLDRPPESLSNSRAKEPRGAARWSVVGV
jgi:hypothetical protein